MDFDGLVIGGGHNGLVCAAYLAKAGQRVGVIERRSRLGGGCMTEEVTVAGFRHDIHSHFHAFGRSPAYADLELERHGLSYIYPETQRSMVFLDGASICMRSDAESTAATFARFSQRDAKRFMELYQRFGGPFRSFLRSVRYHRPLTGEQLAERLTGPVGKEYLTFTRLGLHEAVEQNFGDTRVRCFLKLALHTLRLEDGPGLGHQLITFVTGLGASAIAKGGSAEVGNALGRVVKEHGGLLMTDRHVSSILVRSGRAVGVTLDDGEVIMAKRFVASSIHVRQTLNMTGEEHFGSALADKVRKLESTGNSLVTLHLALNEPPRYSAAATEPAVDRSLDVLFGAESDAEVEAAFASIRRGEIPDPLVGNGACATKHDPSLAPPGKHVAFWWPSAPYSIAGVGPKGWDDVKAELTARMLREWRRYAPNMTDDNVLGACLYTPLDVERGLPNMIDGNPHILGYTNNQLGAARPTPELSQYRTPVEGLYLCGASSHPSGGLNGGPGYNAANVIADDLGVARWWTPVPSPSFAG